MNNIEDADSVSPQEPLKPPSPSNLTESQSRSWGYFVAGMGLTLLAVALGAVLGYLARPALDPVGSDVAVISTPAETLVSIAPTQAIPTPTTVIALSPTASEPATQSNPQPTPPIAENDASTAPPTPTIMDFLLSDARHFQGNDDARVTIVEFSDFKCPYCGRFSIETLPHLREAYINTGQVRFVYRHFAVLGAESNRAAEASECAAEQDRFWEYHDLIFADQSTNGSFLDDDNLISLADEAGLDTSAFRECLVSGRYTSQIRQESQTVQSLGVRGTPGFVINGVYISGAQPFEIFQQVIEEQLKAAEQ